MKPTKNFHIVELWLPGCFSVEYVSGDKLRSVYTSFETCASCVFAVQVCATFDFNPVTLSFVFFRVSSSFFFLMCVYQPKGSYESDD